MNGQDFGVFTRCDCSGIYAVGHVDHKERMVVGWHANTTVPFVSSVENVGKGLVLHLAEKGGKIFLRFEA